MRDDAKWDDNIVGYTIIVYKRQLFDSLGRDCDYFSKVKFKNATFKCCIRPLLQFISSFILLTDMSSRLPIRTLVEARLRGSLYLIKPIKFRS